MPIRTTRSGREVKNSSTKQSKLDALELLERQRRGEKVDIGIKEDEPLFDEVDEEEYKRTKKGGFVVGGDSDEEYDSDDLDFIDDETGEFEDSSGPSKRGKGANSKGRKRKEVEADPRQKSMKSFLGASTSRAAASLSSATIEQPQVEVNQDEILSQMLFDVPVSRTSSAKKPTTSLSRLTPSSAVPSPSTRSISRALPTPSPIGPRKSKAQEVATPSKKLRVAEPEPIIIDTAPNPMDDDFSNDSPAAIYNQMATQESVGSICDEHDNSGIDAAPLNADTKANLEFLTGEDQRPYTRFYWYDCCEGNNASTVLFFGRINAASIKKFVSCCVIVKNIRRTCYLMISKDCTYEEAVGEFTHITAKRLGIKNFTCEKVSKKYAFSDDPDTPLLSEFVKIEYPATQPTMPMNLKGETFCKVLNTNQSAVEKIILELKLRGPTWLRIIDPVASVSPLTWSKIELVVDSPENLLVEENVASLKAPYFCVLSLALQTHAHPTIAGRNDIIAISAMVNTAFNLDECLTRSNKASGHFMLMAKPQASQKEALRLPFDFHAKMKTFNRTRFELLESERDMLSTFMDKFDNLDPDIIVGHDLLNFDFETLIKQMAVNKVGTWSKLGRLKRTTLPSSKKAFPYLFSGRILCDIKKSAEELMQLRSYDLTTLTSKILNRQRVDYNHATLAESFKTSESLINMLHATWEDVDSIFSILVEMNIIPLALKITNITGNIFSRTLAAGRSERNEYLLLHAFHEDNFICPEKIQSRERKGANNKSGANTKEDADIQPQGRRKAAYAGGLVLEPKTGFYETCILLMDFNSLYPSIIQEFNICFSTVKVPDNDDEGSALIPSESTATGILPAQLKNLVDRRRLVKRLMADCKHPMQKTLLDIEQRALKLTANSMYGCLGFEHSRFYAKHLASLVTSKGREILMSTKAMVENLGYEVIYGDTDSLMIDTKLNQYDEVIQRGNAIKSEINRTFKLLEIDIDGVYRPLLLLKKKNYAGASLAIGPDGTISKKIETKGLDSVRRDRAVVAKEASDVILSMIMHSEKDICSIVDDIHNYLKDLSSRLNSNQIDEEKYLISKQLNKNPEEYRDTKGIGHVTIALRHNSDPKQARKLRAGDVIDYVICTDGTSESANQRCYTLAEMKANTELKLDHEYYLCQQIYPAITRICDKLPFTNAYVIAEALGIESNSSIKIPRESSVALMKDQLVSKGEQRYATCEPLVIECPSCGFLEKITSKWRKIAKINKTEFCLSECSSCNLRLATKSRQIVVQVIAHIKRLTLSLYNAKFVCPDCEYWTQNVFAAQNEHDQPICASCFTALVPDMDDRRMDLQLSYYKYLLDIQNNQPETGDPVVQAPADDVRELYRKCHEEVSGALRMSYINTIDAQKVFSMVCSGR